MQNFFLGIIEITLGMTILILLMLILLKLIGGKFTAKCRYILWTLVMIRLAVPLSFGILPALIEVPVEPEPEPVQIQIPAVSYTPIPQEPAAVPQQEQLQMPTLPAETPMFTEPVPDPLTWEEISAYIPHLYLTGAAVFLLWNLLAYMIYTRRILRSAKPADTGIREIYTAVCCKKGIHHPPVLLVSAVVNSPAAFGLIRRRIVLPDIEFTENALVGTLSHEVTHCRRGDLWIKAVCLLARSFHWFNPLVHLAAFRCEMEMELSCDESVLAGCSEDTRAVYGEIMLDIIRRCRNNRGALTTHFNPKKNAVKLRLQNILYGSGKKRGLWLIAVCLVLCLIAGAIVACTTDIPEEETEPETTETPEESLPEAPESGEYPSMEAYVNERMAQKKTVSYYSVSKYNEFPDGGAEAWTATANVTDTSLTVFEKKGEVAGLSEQGVLECWEYRYLLKLDVPADDVMTVDGDFDGWFDMDGQHTVVALRHPDGTYTVLMDNITGDGIDFTGYRDTYEEAIYDWYVTESGLDLPLYVEDWSEQITSPTGEYLGNHPVHRFDGDGWGIYIPVSAWYRSPDAMENQWIWCSSYLTGSMLTVDVCSHTLEDEYVTAELQGYTPTDRTKRIWELDMDDIHSYYYYYENPTGGFWRVTIAWTEEAITDYPAIAIEPQVLKLMAESFVVFGTGYNVDNALTVTSPIYLCDDVYLSNTTSSYGESSITFPSGLNGYKLYDCKVVLCGDECDPHDVVWRNFFGYAGGFPLEELELTQNVAYPTKLYKCTYPEEELALILANMEQQGASEQHKQEYRNKRWYLYLLTLEEDHYACIFLEPEDMTVRPENEQAILDALIASVKITTLTTASADPAAIYQTFLDTVVSPYSEYIVATEFLDLDGNGIDELIIYDWGASANCGIEIFTIENGEVRSFSTTTNAITHYSGEPKSLAPPSANAVNYSFWGLPTSYSDKSDVILWFVPCDSRARNGHVLYSMNGSDVHTSEDYYYFTSDANGNLTVEVLRSFRCEAIDSNPANGWKCYIFGEEVSVRWFHDTMGFFWQDFMVTHGVQYHDKNTASRYTELEAWMEPPLDVEALLEKNLAELRQMEGNQYRAIEAILSGNSSMLESAMGLPSGTGKPFTGITLASWDVARISDDRYYSPIRLTLEISESSSSVFPVGISTWIVDEGLDGVTLTNYENPVVRDPDPTTDAEEAVWTWLRATGQVILPLNRDLTPTEFAEFSKQTTEYACRHADGTLNSIRESVETCFGSTEYFTDTILYSNDGIHYGVGGHGAARHSYNWLGETKNADGSTSVKILFYTDAGKYIPAKTVEYTLRSVGEDLYGQTIWSFESCTVLEDHGYPPFFRWT